MSETPNLRLLETLRLPLLCECQGCGRRATLTADAIRSHGGFYSPVNALTPLDRISKMLVCSGCGGKATARTRLPIRKSEVERFLRGD